MTKVHRKDSAWRTALRIGLGATSAMALLQATAAAQCPGSFSDQNYTGGGSTACPCFVVGEEAGVVLDVPASHYPIEITHIKVGWGSAFGGAPDSLEQAIHIYPAGLPSPGSPQFSVVGPVLTDGFINDFDISIIPGNKKITSGPFMISLEFANTNAGDPFAPTVVHDGNGCQSPLNTVFAIPGGWSNACSLGVTGDWIMSVDYRRLASATFRNGGTNPASYSVTNPAGLGSTFLATVDNNVAGQVTSVLFAFDTAFTLVLSGGQTLLAFDTGNGELFSGGGLAPASTLGGVDSYLLNVPNNLLLCGLTLHSQAIQFGSPPYELSNAQDLYVSDP